MPAKTIVYGLFASKNPTKNLLKENLTKADIIVCFLMPKSLNELKLKLLNESKKGLIFISCAYALKDKEPFKIIIRAEGSMPIYFYRF